MSDNRAIGVFDSGLGGLTVLSAIHQILPLESTIYLGDTARVPYGNKSPDTIRRYALDSAKALIKHTPIKMLVVACNTASAVALDVLEQELSIPVIGVIKPTVNAILQNQNLQHIAVLATQATVNSQAYDKAFTSNHFSQHIQSIACPLFVPLVEEGLVSGDIPKSIIQHYLKQIAPNTQVIILGCTHYPLLLPLMKQTTSNQISFFESGPAVAEEVKTILSQTNSLASSNQLTTHQYLASEAPKRFSELSSLFLKNNEETIQVDLIHI